MVDTVRKNGPFAPLGANYADDDRVTLLDLDEDSTSELLFLRALAYCARDLRAEGFISDIALKAGKVLRRRKGLVEKAADRLVEVGLWEREDDGYRVRSWLKWNKSWEEMTRGRQKDRERKAGERASDSTGSPDDVQSDSARTGDGHDVESTRSPAGVHAPMHFTSLHDTTTPPERADEPPTLSLVAEQGAAPVVAAYIDGATGSGRDRPSAKLVGKVGRDAKRLIAAGTPLARVVEAARECGATGWDDLDRQLQRPQRGKPVSSGNVSYTDEEYRNDGGIFGPSVA